MKTKLLVILSFFLIFAFVVPVSADAATRVSGYTKKNGTYVQPYYKSTPDRTKLNNYSTKGNVNPFTGKAGTVNPYKAPSIKVPTIKIPSIKSSSIKLPSVKYPSIKLPKIKSRF